MPPDFYLVILKFGSEVDRGDGAGEEGEGVSTRVPISLDLRTVAISSDESHLYR